MRIEFRKKEEWFTFTDHQGNVIERKTEIRFDPLTGETSRLIFNPGLTIIPPDYTEKSKLTAGTNCPFCNENLMKVTPVFPQEIAEQGRFFHGNAVCFPNLFPYSKHNGVVIFSNQHYVRLEDFTPSMIRDGFMVAQRYLEKVMATDNKARCASINWNYLPLSGGSILHPHIQVMVSESQTNYQSIIKEKTSSYEKQTGKSFFLSLIEAEKKLGERWIGEYGNIHWIHAYAPKSHNDFIVVFPQARSIDDLKKQDWLNFAKGLTCIFKVLTEQGFESFNLSLNISEDSVNKEPIHVRLIPRHTSGILETSDINFFQALHQESLAFYIPEEISEKARSHFQKIDYHFD
ncbi:hypothetical protein [Bacillus sp. B15-48]|uniref:hypothetical protein n=1 Tax=Bacillus sp. B15-48 TaxID=1548601 RepID=UPI00193FA781|nr:hypothetical protein [Bacillus sp. B15-48]MBM4763777.1 hypothetical protein [Bacillus sp. B15-48]